MKTVYENAREMLELAAQARKEAEERGDEAAVARWEVRLLDAHAELCKFFDPAVQS